MTKFTDILINDLLSVDPIRWAETFLNIKGSQFMITDNGREYLHEIYRYLAFEAPTDRGKPIIVVKGRQVEMTTTVTVLSMYYMTSGVFKHMNGLHAFPRVEQARRYSASTLDLMLRQANSFQPHSSFVLDHGDPDGTFIVGHKQFKNANQLFIEGTSNEGDRLRGMVLDFILFDEVQDTFKAARENAVQAMTHSKYGPPGRGVEISFGTPKDKNTEFERMWVTSDQRRWHLKCSECGEFFPITLQNYKTGYMVECDFCHKLQDKRTSSKEGKWIPMKQDNPTRRGYHISQLLVPYITREAISAAQKDMGARQFTNEVMGEFYAGQYTAPTFEEIVRATCIGNEMLRFADYITPPQVGYMGIDWGGRIAGKEDDGQGSYTAIVILGESDNVLDGQLVVKYATRLTMHDFAKQIEAISELIRRFNCVEVVADMGWGHVQVQNLQKEWGERVKGCWFSANTRDIYKYDKDSNIITVDKHRIIEEVYDEIIQKKKFRFPYSNPADVEWLAEHTANVEIDTTTAGGMLKRRYEKPVGRPNDGFMALNYARLARLMRSTGGFVNMGMGGASIDNKGYNMPKPALARVSR